MPNDITDSPVFTDPIQTVADSDAASGANFALAPQGLANRTRHLKNVLEPDTALIDVSASGVTDPGVATLALVAGDQTTAGWPAIVSLNQLWFPRNGWYMAHVRVGAHFSDTTADLAVTGQLFQPPSFPKGSIYSIRAGTNAFADVSFSGAIIFEIIDYTTNYVQFWIRGDGAGTFTVASDSMIYITEMKRP